MAVPLARSVSEPTASLEASRPLRCGHGYLRGGPELIEELLEPSLVFRLHLRGQLQPHGLVNLLPDDGALDRIGWERAVLLLVLLIVRLNLRSGHMRRGNTGLFRQRRLQQQGRRVALLEFHIHRILLHGIKNARLVLFTSRAHLSQLCALRLRQVHPLCLRGLIGELPFNGPVQEKTVPLGRHDLFHPGLLFRRRNEVLERDSRAVDGRERLIRFHPNHSGSQSASFRHDSPRLRGVGPGHCRLPRRW
jgi:hypothetical protein